MADGRIVGSDAQARAAERLRAASGEVTGMFDGARIGDWTTEDAWRYVEGLPAWWSLEAKGEAGHVFGMMLAFAVVCVERDRETRKRNRWRR